MFGQKQKRFYKKTYSQLGEDAIVDFLFECQGINKPTYIDIGAHDPYELSNTAYFYEKGCHGINIEPNPILFDNIRKVRKRDVNLNIGIGKENDILKFYVMNAPTMSTFSEEQAKELTEKFKFQIQQTLDIKVCTLTDVIKEYNSGVFPDFMSLDAEGLDYMILQTIDFERSFPKVICVETVEYSENLNGKKEEEIINFLKDRGYRVFADTYINTIFARF